MKNLALIFLAFLLTNQVMSQNNDCANPTDALFLKGVWVGKFTQYSCDISDTYPMTIEINNVNGEKFNGNFIWKDVPNSPGSRTSLEGEIITDKLLICELMEM